MLFLKNIPIFTVWSLGERMDFLFVIPSLSSGGAERVVTVLANELVKQNNKATIVYYFSSDNEYFVDKRVNLINLSGGNQDDYFKIGYFTKLKILRNIIKKENPDYVIPFLSHVCAHTVCALMGLRFKIIQTVRNNPELLPESKKQRALRDFLINHSYKTLVQNETQKQYFKKSIHKKIFVLPNPVREDLFEAEKAKSESNFVIASAGRLNYQKNFKMLIDSVENICKNNDNVVLKIYGDGELKDELTEYIRKKSLENSVFLMGRTNDMKSMLQSIDLYILSSDFEGMPNSLMEAMAAGVPCISTDCPTGPSDIITDGENGFLVPVNDSVAMEKAIERMMNSDMDLIAKNGREFVKENYSPKTIVNKFIDICNS